MRKYQYIWFGEGRRTFTGVDKDEYNYMCTEDLEGLDDVQVVPYPLSHYNYFIGKLYSLCVRVDRKIIKKQLLEKFWFSQYFDKRKLSKKPICFIISGFYIKPDYLEYLKTKFPNAKIVKIYRDSYCFWRTRNPEFTDDDICRYFDIQFSFDRSDSKNYGMIHFDEIASVNNVSYSNNYPLHDVFFAGVIKDRLDKLIKVYDYLTSQGINCFFYLTKPGNKKKIYRKGIVYSDDNMSYKEMLYHSVNSRVILEINQKGVDGFTSRFLEAVMYNKKLITDNMYIKKHHYYDLNYIKCFSNVEDINIDFIKREDSVDYGYKGDFSPIKLLNKIDDALKNMDQIR